VNRQLKVGANLIRVMAASSRGRTWTRACNFPLDSPAVSPRMAAEAGLQPRRTPRRHDRRRRRLGAARPRLHPALVIAAGDLEAVLREGLRPMVGNTGGIRTGIVELQKLFFDIALNPMSIIGQAWILPSTV
jgi:hypothetical protein